MNLYVFSVLGWLLRFVLRAESHVFRYKALYVCR